MIRALRPALAPHAKFGDEIYGTFLRTYMNEQKLAADFEILEAFTQANGFQEADKALKAGTVEGLHYLGVDHFWSNEHTANHVFAGVKKIERLVREERPDIAHLHNIYHHLTPSIIPVLN